MANDIFYPDVVTDIKGVIPFQWGYEQKIIKNQFANGSESRRLMWQTPRRAVSIQYSYLQLYDTQRLYDFYASKSGPYQSFAFFFPQTQEYTKEFCGTSDGEEHSINLPSKIDASIQPVSYELYQGENVFPSASYLVSLGTGPNSEDVLTLVNPTATFLIGKKYYWSFVGRLKLKARFDENPVEIEEVKDQYSTFTVNLTGLQATLR
jgi:hypothetical protein